jgi:hypothetical protein
MVLVTDGSNQSGLATAALRLSHTIALGTPPKNFSARTWASIQPGSFLAEAGPGEGVIGSAKHGDEYLGAMFLIRRRIDHRKGVASVVRLHHRIRLMTVAITWAVLIAYVFDA